MRSGEEDAYDGTLVTSALLEQFNLCVLYIHCAPLERGDWTHHDSIHIALRRSARGGNLSRGKISQSDLHSEIRVLLTESIIPSGMMSRY